VSLYMHWNGFNAQGKPVAPGVYREVLLLDYTASGSQDERRIITYGVKR